MVEIWQCNAAGRYHHPGDQHDAPLDPNFYGGGRVRADEEGRYQFITIKPGAYPWKNHHNAWRPAHIHFSLFGPAFATRLITQMYFPDDPLLGLRPDLQLGARGRAQAPAGVVRHGVDAAGMGARLQVRHRAARPQRHADGKLDMSQGLTPSQTIGPFYFGTIIKAYHHQLAPPGVAGERIELALTLYDGAA